ncbi:MAG: hypothetical protein HYT37_01940 [Candidatus Sungbacteria bacterium]|nr:hypothetical protein [Candidatus Sungbacteria bacterium]
MARKWLRKLECKICGEPVDPKIKGRICSSCRGPALQDDEDPPSLPTYSNFQKRLAQGFRLLYTSGIDDLDD